MPPERSLASLVQNADFPSNSAPCTSLSENRGRIGFSRFYFRVARKFLDAYFTNVHHVQPLLDEEEFLSRCEDLWFDTSERQSLSFVALYYATLSLGCLLMVWEDREMYGTDRFTWSRRLFDDALGIVKELGSETDVELVQCYYMLVRSKPYCALLKSDQIAALGKSLST